MNGEELYNLFVEKLCGFGDSSEYVRFCLERRTIYKKGLTQRHHILPRCLFPEYKSFKNSWNIVNLTNKDHYIAHYFLAKFSKHPSMISAWYAMNNKNFLDASKPIELIGSENYCEMIKIRDKMSSERNKGKVIAKDLETGEILRVTKEEFDSNPNLVGATKGRGGEHFKGTHLTTMKNKETGLYEKVDIRSVNRDLYEGTTKGFCIFKDSQGNKVYTRTDDPRVLSGELCGLRKGTHYHRKEYIHGPKRKYIVINLDSGDRIEIFKKKNFLEYLKENNIDLRKNRNIKIEKYRFKNNEWRKI